MTSSSDSVPRRYIVPDSTRTPLSAFQIDWLPPWAFEYLTPRVSRDGTSVEIEAGPYVGAIPLANGEVLWIVPRAGQASFARMIVVSEGLGQTVRRDIEEEAVMGFEHGPSSLAGVLARPFLRRLRRIEKLSPSPGRELIRQRRGSARGAIEPVSTTIAVQRRERLPVVSITWEKTYQTPENRVLGAAATQLLHVGEVPDDFRATAGRWADMVKGKRLRNTELRHVVAALSRGAYSGYRSYYAPALAMARMILSHASIDFVAAHMLASQAMITNVPQLFERYVRRLLSDELAPDGVVVEKIDGGIKARRLFADGTGELLPDVLVSKRGRSLLVADAKYKPGRAPDATDYYQMAVYLKAYKCSKGMLVSPAQAGAAESWATRRRFLDGRELIEVRIALSEPDSAEEFLKTTIRAEVL